MCISLDQAKQDINDWIENFLEVSNPNLNNWSPCPYARSARLKQSYDVRIGNDLYQDLLDISNSGLDEYEVVIFVYNTDAYTAYDFQEDIQRVNLGFLVPKDLIALDDHPNHLENVNNVIMNNGKYALAMVQSLSDLNNRASSIARKGFYEHWPEHYLNDLFENREDPRV